MHIQKILDENSALIQTIQEFQLAGIAGESMSYQMALHRNLIYLANLADSRQNVPSLLPHVIQQQQQQQQPSSAYDGSIMVQRPWGAQLNNPHDPPYPAAGGMHRSGQKKQVGQAVTRHVSIPQVSERWQNVVMGGGAENQPEVAERYRTIGSMSPSSLQQQQQQQVLVSQHNPGPSGAIRVAGIPGLGVQQQPASQPLPPQAIGGGETSGSAGCVPGPGAYQQAQPHFGYWPPRQPPMHYPPQEGPGRPTPRPPRSYTDYPAAGALAGAGPNPSSNGQPALGSQDRGYPAIPTLASANRCGVAAGAGSYNTPPSTQQQHQQFHQQSQYGQSFVSSYQQQPYGAGAVVPGQQQQQDTSVGPCVYSSHPPYIQQSYAPPHVTQSKYPPAQTGYRQYPQRPLYAPMPPSEPQAGYDYYRLSPE